MRRLLSERKNYLLFSRKIFPVLIFVILSQISFASKKYSLTILHTNDQHAQYLPMKAHWISQTPKPLIGGMKALSGYVEREKNDHTLFLDAGDIHTGTLLSKLAVNGVQCGGIAKIMNLLGYHATVIGNHEFDQGIENLGKWIDLCRFDVLSANLDSIENALSIKPYEIYNINKLNIGVIGLTIETLVGLVPKKHIGNIIVHPIIPVAQKIIHQIDPLTDIIVLLTHQGIEADSILAANIDGADIIIGGHSHTRLYNPRRIKNVIVAQAGSHNQYLGRLDLTVHEDTLSAFQGTLIPLWVDSIQANPEIARLVDTYQNEIENEFGHSIGELVTDWQRSRYTESNIGNYITDVIRDITKTDFAVLNSGGIRKDLEAGPIRRLDIMEMLPFENNLVMFQVTGQELLHLIKTNAEASLLRNHGVLQVSGISYSIEKDENNKMVIANTVINNQAIESEKMYSGVTVDYVIYDNPFLYFGFQPKSTKILDSMLSDIMIAYIQNHPEVNISIDQRIQINK